MGTWPKLFLTGKMRDEQRQIRVLSDPTGFAHNEVDTDEALNQKLRTLHLLAQRHSTNEESVLYPADLNISREFELFPRALPPEGIKAYVSNCF